MWFKWDDLMQSFVEIPPSRQKAIIYSIAFLQFFAYIAAYIG
jgi:hypothetical protein